MSKQKKHRIKINKNKVEYVDSVQFEQLSFEDILKEKKNESKESKNLAFGKLEKTETLFENVELKSEDTRTPDMGLTNIPSLKEIKPLPSIIDTKTGKVNRPIIVSDVNLVDNNFLNAYNQKENSIRLEKEWDRAVKSFPYVASGNILTRAEAQLFHFMKQFIKEEVEIFPKVRLADIIEMDKDVPYSEKDFYKICYKHIDYLICDSKNFNIICAVELDDPYHELDRVKKKDMFITHVLHECKIPLVRIKTKIDIISDDDMIDIDNLIKAYFAPPCPLCGSQMEVKSSKRYHNYGHRFWSCKQFPICRGNIDID